ncbi:trehalose 6-phosphate phosphatase [Humitalea rosea]|uniref:Trehalose 6-phosphate phosphatase n=1 Tax=Humitalea rosea TaxID=990373 RepID=A0A2W7ID46_9PROT|nr:trehalose-phosphatase [Humitalea rosea]PZW44886.1 trehalose 6-phosphate phosphatase [Humitalea rosea]
MILTDIPSPREIARNGALFLDFDGTLVDIAPTPESVHVPASLPGLLIRVAARLEGALAILTGRPLAVVDAFLAPARFAAGTEHGSFLRHTPDATPIATTGTEVPQAWRDQADRLRARFPAAQVEHKQAGFAVHFRANPEAGPPIEIALAALVETDPRFALLPARMAWEVKPRGADKGTALEALMRAAPFLGRRPMMIGDDVTDEDAMAAARRAGGWGLRLQDTFGDPAALHVWLAAIAEACPNNAMPQ